MSVDNLGFFFLTCSFQNKLLPPLVVIYLKYATNNTKVALSETHWTSHTLIQFSNIAKAAVQAAAALLAI